VDLTDVLVGRMFSMDSVKKDILGRCVKNATYLMPGEKGNTPKKADKHA